MKQKLLSIESYLDVDKLVQDLQKQEKDSYAIRCLLTRVKEHSGALLQIES